MDIQQLQLQQQRSELRTEIAYLEAKIKEAPSLVISSSSNSEDDEYDDDNVQEEQLYAWQAELESLLEKLAELEETERVQVSIQKAIDINLVDRPSLTRNDVGKCVLCHDDITDIASVRENNHGRFWCCGATACYQCFTNYDRNHNAILTEETTHRQHFQSGPRLEVAKRCPRCGGLFQVLHGRYTPTLLRHAEEDGESWAQFEIGQCFQYGLYVENGRGVGIDLVQAGEWYKRAADNGNVLAMLSYAQYLINQGGGGGFREAASSSSSSSTEQAVMAYAMAAARQGLAAAQYLVGTKTTNHEEKIMWLVLAAAQGCNSAELALGSLCEKGCCGDDASGGNGNGNGIGIVRPCDYAAMYWYRKVATKGYHTAGIALAQCLLRAKAQLFGGDANVVGYSAVPEAYFWYHSPLLPSPSMRGQSVVRIEQFDAIADECGCCLQQASPRRKRARTTSSAMDGTNTSTGSASNMVTMKRCTRCYAIAYCSKDCQALHWAMGHQMDCQRVDACRLAYETQKGENF